MKAMFPKDFAYREDCEITVRTLWNISKAQNEDLELWFGDNYYCISSRAKIEPFLVHIMSAK